MLRLDINLLFTVINLLVLYFFAKKFLFGRVNQILEERKALIRRVTVDLPNVEVDCSSELLADYARRRGSCVIVKGLRAGSDFENEFQMALVNRKLNPELDTMFLTAASQYMYLSSSMVKELGNYGAELSDFLPEEIIPDFREKLCKKMEDSQ